MQLHLPAHAFLGFSSFSLSFTQSKLPSSLAPPPSPFAPATCHVLPPWHPSSTPPPPPPPQLSDPSPSLPAPSSAELKQQRRSGDLAAASCTPATVSFPQSPSPPPASSSAARARRITRAHDDADSTGHSDVDLQVRRGFTR
jgi:hypothetical protein